MFFFQARSQPMQVVWFCFYSVKSWEILTNRMRVCSLHETLSVKISKKMGECDTARAELLPRSVSWGAISSLGQNTFHNWLLHCIGCFCSLQWFWHSLQQNLLIICHQRAGSRHLRTIFSILQHHHWFISREATFNSCVNRSERQLQESRSLKKAVRFLKAVGCSIYQLCSFFW